ncbi:MULTISPECIES: hypothetical protein [Vibrio]|uniref:hypothetical protein n=1 Tax=Vibrio TaxID=662 RepID=UPI0010BD521E|nr:hypothetical protein [Vibrio sp. F12]TKE85091.1 hypothetical protein FCV54_07500 [Vibrio sp. F12]
MLLAIFVALAIVLLALLQSCAPAVEPPTGPLGPNSSYEQGQGQAQKGGNQEMIAILREEHQYGTLTSIISTSLFKIRQSGLIRRMDLILNSH